MPIALAFRSVLNAASCAALTLALAASPAFAQDTETDVAVVAEQPASAPTATSDAPAANIDLLAGPDAVTTGITTPTFAPEPTLTGFRSARFGMDQAAVRKAIAADFGTTRIFESRSPIERTRSLTVLSDDVLPDGGKAQVSYVFGFRSKTLIQVGVSWSKATDKSLTPKDLADNGTLLKRHFLKAGYVPETVRSDVLVAGGLLLFRGEDERGQATILLLQGKVANAETKPELKPEALALLYSVNPDDPDVLKIKKSDF